MFNSILTLIQQMLVVTIKTGSAHCHISPGGKNCLLENYFVLNSLNKYLLTACSIPSTLCVPGLGEQRIVLDLMGYLVKVEPELEQGLSDSTEQTLTTLPHCLK